MRAYRTEPEAGVSRPIAGRPGFTVVEMLVVVAIISLLIALLFPALNAARESGRRATCQNNLRQIGVGLQAHASSHGAFCSGAFDWARDGSVTEVGWVADMVNTGIPVGKMLCPSNPNRISETYNDLATLAGVLPCGGATVEELKGSVPKPLPDGTDEYNPCRYILDNPDGLNMNPGSSDRLDAIETRILEQDYNTNYTASWVLVRGEPVLTPNGNPRNCPSGCSAIDCYKSRVSTAGPLTLKLADGSKRPASFIPLMGCGGAGPSLQAPFGDEQNGTYVTWSFTRGPVLSQDAGSFGPPLLPPSFVEADEGDPYASPPVPATSGTPRTGPLGWWATWETTLQDYRRFGPVHRGGCNILFADGSVRTFDDDNKDGLLNNGFTTAGAPTSGFSDDSIELPEEGVFSGWTLKPQ